MIANKIKKDPKFKGEERNSKGTNGQVAEEKKASIYDADRATKELMDKWMLENGMLKR